MSHQLPELPETPYLTFWREEATPMNPFHAEHFKFSDVKLLPWGRQNLVRLYTADQMRAYAELAIASVKREPLSDEQIEAIWESHKYKLSGWDYDGMSVMQETDFERGARAIEQAHGIGATVKDPEQK
ncbi:hypothetical protein PQR63_20750 [Herbaspirillum rhizosphaerae]|uniref:Uncharacterized protein n=1 Tax=Herbaspirillum rhizosphaerae TaxID=346179 RepID=A0ABW8ZDI7_9BURK